MNRDWETIKDQETENRSSTTELRITRIHFNYRGILISNEPSVNAEQAHNKQIFRKKLNADKERLKRINFSEGTICVRNRPIDFI